MVQSPVGALVLSAESWCTQVLFGPLKSGVSGSLSLVEVLSSNPAGLQGQVSWGFPVPFLDPQAGKPDVELRIFTTVGELRWYHCSPVCESSTHNLGMGFDFIMIAPLQ